MSQGLDPQQLLVMQWQWLPRQPLSLDAPLPTATVIEDGALFRAQAQDEALWPIYRFNFAQLAVQTPDLHFYRLVQHFNTPLLSLSRREAGRHRYAYWDGDTPLERLREGQAYFWFFDDQKDGDIVVLEYDFDGRFMLRSQRKSSAQLTQYYQEICAKINKAL